MRRRALLGLPVAALAAAVPAGCASPDDPTAQRWHMGELAIGTGNPTGVFYEVGAGYAEVVNRHLTGYEAVAAPTNGSIDNLNRLATGDVDICLAFSDNAADALHGTGPFQDHPQPVRALARTYNNYLHVIARTDRGITSVAGMRAKRVSTGTHNSGTELMAIRALTVAGLNPDKDLTTLALSLADTTAGLATGSIDAMFWSGGLPTTGVVDLFQQAAGQVKFLAVDSLLAALAAKYGAGIYTAATLPRASYGLPADVPTIAAPNLLVVQAGLPADLAYQLTGLLFRYKDELAAVHPVVKDISRDLAPKTDPVPLHPGAARYYGGS